MKIVYFTNYTDEPLSFTPYEVKGKRKQDENCKWDGQPYAFAPGQSTPLEEAKALHFAGVLADKILNEKNLPTNHIEREEIIAKAISPVVAEAETETQLEDKLAEETVKSVKRESKKKVTKASEEEFEGLNEE